MILLCFFIKKSNAPQIKSYFIKLLLCFVNSLSTHLHLIVDDFLKKSWASFLHIPPGRIEIAGVPRIGYLAGTVGKVHQQMHLVGKIAAADAVHTPQVGMIHANQKVVFLVVAVQQYHNTFEIAIEKSAISERKDNVRTGLCGNSGQNFAGLSFCGFLLLYQRAEQLGNAAQIDICHLVSSLSWICI